MMVTAAPTLSVTGFRCVGGALRPWGREVAQEGPNDRRRAIWTHRRGLRVHSLTQS